MAGGAQGKAALRQLLDEISELLKEPGLTKRAEPEISVTLLLRPPLPSETMAVVVPLGPGC